MNALQIANLLFYSIQTGKLLPTAKVLITPDLTFGKSLFISEDRDIIIITYIPESEFTENDAWIA